MATRTYRLKVVREGREFEAEGDKAFVLDMLKRFSPLSAEETAVPSVAIRPGKGKRAAIAAIAARAGAKSVSIREFIQQLAFKRHTDITLAFGYYLEKYLGVPEFTPGDINTCYYDAKQERSNKSNDRREHQARLHDGIQEEGREGSEPLHPHRVGRKIYRVKARAHLLEENHGESYEGDEALAISPVGV
jgi:hypothetical protein